MKKMIVKSTAYSLLAFVILYVIFINLGKFFNVSQPPYKSDVIVCLGGGSGERVERTLQLYQQGYSRFQKIILTGSIEVRGNRNLRNKRQYLIDNGVPKDKILFLPKTTNTMKEMRILKHYLLDHHLQSVMIVSDPPHSRRIMFLANSIAHYRDNGLSVRVVSSHPQWWNQQEFYKNRKALSYVVAEIIKFPTNILVYMVIEPLGLYDPIQKYFGDTIHFIKHYIHGKLRM